ncbi:winged helix-turn-helix transcriptional regulator, partial [Streptococcus suis]
KELEQEGILRRNCDAGPSHPIYELTAEGRSLSDVVQQLRTWGETHTVPSISA